MMLNPQRCAAGLTPATAGRQQRTATTPAPAPGDSGLPATPARLRTGRRRRPYRTVTSGASTAAPSRRRLNEVPRLRPPSWAGEGAGNIWQQVKPGQKTPVSSFSQLP